MKKLFWTGLTIISLLSGVSIASASVVYNLGGCDFSTDSGGTGSCGGSGADLPYNAVIMTFTQNGTNTVKMTLDASNMPDSTGKISDIWFNIEHFALNELTFSWISGVQANSFQAGGNVSSAGSYDINEKFNVSGNLGDFYYNQISIYNITATDLLESHFDATYAAGFGPVMHVNITGNDNSGHYTTTTPIPEPATMLLFGTGLAGLGTIFRRRLK